MSGGGERLRDASIRAAILGIAVATAGAAASAQSDETSERSLERLRYDCASEIERRDITLFGNGTLRLRQGSPGIERMWLVELGRSELQAYLRRLTEPTRDETPMQDATVSGEWIEHCVLELRLEGRGPERFELDRYDTMTLDLQRTVAIAEELAARVDTSAPAEGEAYLPSDYEAEVGDVLRRPDGSRFRVSTFTSDGEGVELIGIDEPITVYLVKTELSSHFVAVEREEGS